MERLFITPDHEAKNIMYLVQMLKPFVQKRDVLIINCSPDYSSIGSQILSHQLSPNFPLRVAPCEMPYPYQKFSVNEYLSALKVHFEVYHKIICFDAGCIRGKNYSKVDKWFKNNYPEHDVRYATLFENINSQFKCGYPVEHYNANTHDLHFWWETETNPAWFK